MCISRKFPGWGNSFLEVWRRGACLRGHVQGARTHVFNFLEDPGSELSSCNFRPHGGDHAPVAAAASLWLPLKRLTLSSIS